MGQLADTMGGDELNKDQLKQAIAAFTKALFVAVPAARQTTQSGASPWEFAKVLVRKGQRLQVPFDEPVKAAGRGF
ncbi:type I-E CRISPR-associated protein Cas7/Cse4/CasC [Edwardsiella anguillarum]|nr:type I-E CRISPR-associated protein Cas7/Cse4/CasC [Edwardsiella anguillarum]